MNECETTFNLIECEKDITHYLKTAKGIGYLGKLELLRVK